MKKLFLLGAFALLMMSCGSDDAEDNNVPCTIPSVDILGADTNTAFIDWDQAEATSAMLEYGLSGFSVGSGTSVSSSQSFNITGLSPETSYDVYMSVSCGNGGTSLNAGPFVFTTASCSLVGIDVFNIEQTQATVGFGNVNNETVTYEYGLAGFQIGNGTAGQTVNGSVQLEGLISGTTYDIYVSRVCGSTTGPLNQASFTTLPSCVAPDSFSGNASSTAGRVNLFWNSGNNSAWRVEYGLSGFQLGTGQEVNTSSSNLVIEGLTSGQTYEFYVQTNCGSLGFSDFLGPLPLIPN